MLTKLLTALEDFAIVDQSRLKRSLVGTTAGRFLTRGRHIWELWRTLVRSNPEKSGMLCQEIIAELLVPSLCTPSSVFVDVGAHIGSVIAAVRRYHPSIQVLAVEAVPDKASALSRKFPDIEVHSCAVGEAEGDITFHVNKTRPGYSSLRATQRSTDDVCQISVPMRRLDDIVAESAKIDVVKIDVEGAELGVLRGAPRLISRCRPVILFESGPGGGKELGYTVEALFDWFADSSYEVLVPNRVAHHGPPLSREGFLESHYYPFRTLNYFAVPTERQSEIRDRARKGLGIAAND